MAGDEIKAAMVTWSREALMDALSGYVDALNDACGERDALRRVLLSSTDELAAEMVFALYREVPWH